MPVENQALEEDPANQHDHPIAIQRGAFSRRGDIIKCRHAIPDAAPNCLQAIPKQNDGFSDPKISDVLQLAGKARIDMIAFDVVRRRRGGAIGGPIVTFPALAPVSAETLKHQLNHVALAVVRGRSVSKDEQLHSMR